MDLKNTWCKATEDNFNALLALGVYEADDWTWKDIVSHGPVEKTDIFGIKYGQFQNSFNWVRGTHSISQRGVQIHLVNGQFEYVATKNYPDVSIENANKYKEMFNQGITDDQKEELEQLGINKAPECQFAKYGFEVPEFEGEILKELSDHNGKKYFIGYSVDVRVGIAYPYPKTWTEDGKCVNDDDIKIDGFDLTPIKKPWYEDESNIGKAVIDLGTTEMLKIIGLGGSSEQIRIGYNESINYYLKASKARLATKEEVLSLYKEEK